MDISGIGEYNLSCRAETFHADEHDEQKVCSEPDRQCVQHEAQVLKLRFQSPANKKQGEAMSVREELLFDFAINMPRVLVSGETTVLDNVRKVMLLTDSEIVVFSGAKYTSLKGRGFVITQLKEGRMLVSGEVEEIRFFSSLQEDKD